MDVLSIAMVQYDPDCVFNDESKGLKFAKALIDRDFNHNQNALSAYN